MLGKRQHRRLDDSSHLVRNRQVVLGNLMYDCGKVVARLGATDK